MLLSVHGNKKQPLSLTIPSQTLKEVVKVKLNFTEAVLFLGVSLALRELMCGYYPQSLH